MPRKQRKCLTPEEKERRKHQRSADRKNDAEREELGPLFEGQALLRTSEDEYWHWRRNKARAAEAIGKLEGAKLLDGLHVAALAAEAREHMPADAWQSLCDYARRTYPEGEPLYAFEFWVGVLTGKRVVFSWRKESDADSKSGMCMVPAGAWPPEGWVAPFTADQLSRKFWHLCSACKRWHAPGQGECLESGELGLALPVLEGNHA